MQLSWQPGFSTHKKPTKRSIMRRPRWEASGDSLCPRQLEFINEYLGKETPNNELADTTTSPPPPTRTIHDGEHDLPTQPGTVVLSSSQFPSRFPFFSSVVSRSCDPRLIESQTGLVEEGASIDHDDMGGPEPSNPYESMFFGIDQIPFDTDRTHAMMESQPHLNNAGDKTLSASQPNRDRNCQIGLSDDVGSDTIFIFSSSGWPSTAAYSDPQASFSYNFRPTIPASVIYKDNFERLESIFERCGSISCL